jgi:DNA-binding XRE family transcriptional regulator
MRLKEVKNLEKMRDNLTLKACRIIAKIKAEEMAASVGVTVDTLYKWEKGKSHPTAPQMIKILQCFANKGYLVDINDINFFV